MLKAEFRFFLDDSMPFLNFHIRVGHAAVPIKKLRDWLAVLVYFFSRLKSSKKKTCFGQPGTRPHPWFISILHHWHISWFSNWAVMESTPSCDLGSQQTLVCLASSCQSTLAAWWGASLAQELGRRSIRCQKYCSAACMMSCLLQMRAKYLIILMG